MNLRSFLAASLGLLVFSFAEGPASAVLIVATDGSSLVSFDSATPGTISSVPVTGLVAGESLLGIDFRPATGQLFGFGNSGRLYVFDRSTGNATAIGAGAILELSGGTYGSDWDATTDRLRIVSNAGVNLTVNVDAGTATKHSPLKDNSPTNNVAAIAYTHPFSDATATTLYGLGSVTGQLLRIGDANATTPASVNNGAVTAIGTLGLGNGLNQNMGLDIAPDGVAYAAIFSGSSKLFRINLQTGAATLVGTIGDGGTTFRGLAVQSGPFAAIASTPILVPAAGSTGGAGGAPGSPYPSNVTVSGLAGVTTHVRVTLLDVRHHFPADIDVLLVAPDGRKMVLMSDVGGSNSTCGALCDNGSNEGSEGVNLTFDDAATGQLDNVDALVSGGFKPTDFGGSPTDAFPSPAPAGPYSAPPPTGSATLASVFNGGNPNGTWSLYVVDDGNNDTGRIADGWILELTATPPSAHLANISTRLRLGQGDSALIGGFIITGSGPKKLIVRALGPSLPVQGRLANPRLDIFNANQNKIATNDNWKQSPQKQQIIATKIPPKNDLEAAAVGSLPAGAYTAVVSGVNGGTGLGLVEAYDLNSGSDAKLANISTRGLVQTGDNVLIAGFIVAGNAEQKLIVRAIGPSLPFANKLKDPELEVFNEDGMSVVVNDNWRSNQEAEIIATGVAPTNNKEAAFVMNARPGAYTVRVRGVAETTGIGSVEVYALDD